MDLEVPEGLVDPVDPVDLETRMGQIRILTPILTRTRIPILTPIPIRFREDLAGRTISVLRNLTVGIRLDHSGRREETIVLRTARLSLSFKLS